MVGPDCTVEDRCESIARPLRPLVTTITTVATGTTVTTVGGPLPVPAPVPAPVPVPVVLPTDPTLRLKNMPMARQEG